MADSKKYNGSTWEHSLRKLTTATDTFTTLPAVIYSDGTNATVGLKGNMSQTGTPTPDNPIIPQGTGQKTANLLFKKIVNGGINPSGQVIESITYNLFVAKVTAGDTVTASNFAEAYAFYGSEPATGSISIDNTRYVTYDTPYTITIPNGAEYIAVRAYSTQDNTMLNLGSTALPYEPYGYKIPILSNSITTNIYLGEVESTRRVKKLVLTGEEGFTEVGSGGIFRLSLDGYLRNSDNVPCSTHYNCIAPVSATNQIPNETIAFLVSGSGNNYLYIRDDTYINSVTNFKAYLAQQYATGTPVTVWYILATETTGIVNEPLMKIGDYADTLGNVSIPTIDGANTITVDTTVQPSEVTATFHGWHDASVQEYVGGVVNKFNINTTWNPPTGQTATITVSGESVTITGKYYAYVAIPVTANGTYTAKYSGTGDRVYVVAYRDTPFNTANMIAGLSTSGTTINVSETDTLYILFYSGAGAQGTTTYSDIMLVEGSTVPSEYHPYYEWV